MQSVYRGAKSLDGHLKAGAGLNELHNLQGNLATELAIVHDRMTNDPSIDRLLSNYAAYQAVLQSYSLVTDIVEYHRTSEGCIAPRHEPADETHRQRMSLDEKMADLRADAEFSNRVIKCVERYRDLDRSLHQRADLLGMNCPKFEWDSGCLIQFAETKLVHGEKLLFGTLGNPGDGGPGSSSP
jgi:hypothetical protein